MATSNYPRPSIGHVGSYQVSGVPYLTGSTLLTADFATDDAQQQFQFPSVTKSITVINTNGVALKIHYNALSDGNVSSGHHYVTLSGSNQSITMYHKAKEVYVSLVVASADADFELIADLTNIRPNEMYDLTGSGLTE